MCPHTPELRHGQPLTSREAQRGLLKVDVTAMLEHIWPLTRVSPFLNLDSVRSWNKVLRQKVNARVVCGWGLSGRATPGYVPGLSSSSVQNLTLPSQERGGERTVEALKTLLFV